MTGSLLFPESYAPWLASRLPGGVSERLATCDACAMEKPEGLTRDPGPFDPQLKCCTYFPFVPNFGLGGMLVSMDEAASLRMKSALGRGILLPLGLFASPEHEARIERAGPKGFGRRKDLLCPFYDTAANGCSVWRNRPGVCATYFCKSERGKEGLELWQNVESYLNHFEWTLANAVLRRLGFMGDETEKCEAVMLTEGPGPERDWLVRLAWAEWFGREDEFFKIAYERARQVTSEDLSELLGDDALSLEESLRKRMSG